MGQRRDRSGRRVPATLGELTGLIPVPSHEVTAPPPSMKQRVEQVYDRYPRLRALPVEVVDSRGRRPDIRGGLEYYPPDELYNPRPGRNTIELFNPALQGAALESALAGDMLHGLPSVDPVFAAQRAEFNRSITPEQEAFDRRAYADGRESHDTFESWMDRSQLDAYIRGYLFPDHNDEWRKQGVYTERQKAILKNMGQLLGMDPSVRPMPSHERQRR